MREKVKRQVDMITGRWEIVEVHTLRDGVWTPYTEQIGQNISGFSLARLIVQNPETSHVETVDDNPNEILFYDMAFDESIGQPLHRRGRFRRV